MPKFDVGGQAVIEGVMMRSPKSFAVVCRRASGEIVIKEDAWRPIWRGLKFLRWPFFRGSISLVESMWNGYSALNFSAEQQLLDEAEDENAPRSLGAAAAKKPQKAATWLMFAVSIVFGLALFVGAPHLVAWLLGGVFGYEGTSFWFHIVDGVVKVAILLGYLYAISFLPDVRRVFQYHGAEHKSIATYEDGVDLTVENARQRSRFHPRCGTSFLLIVVMISVVIFAATLRMKIFDKPIFDHLVKILIKLPLMLPVAGLAYELLKLSGKYYGKSAIVSAIAAPGLWLQKITTREPTDDQLEIALISIRKTLWRERQNEAAAAGGDVEVFSSAAAIDLPLA